MEFSISLPDMKGMWMHSLGQGHQGLLVIAVDQQYHDG